MEFLSGLRQSKLKNITRSVIPQVCYAPHIVSGVSNSMNARDAHNQPNSQGVASTSNLPKSASLERVLVSSNQATETHEMQSNETNGSTGENFS